jgi:hypothetical protein
MSDDYQTMKELGATFGMTCHEVGKKLKELGLRTRDGRPTREAFKGGYCSQRWTQDGQHYCWAWHGEKTVKLLQEEMGRGRTGGHAKA